MKGEVIPNILVQESLKSELWLQRYGEKKLRDLFVISRKWLGVFLEIFRKLGVFTEFSWITALLQKNEGPLCKFLRIIDFWIYFSIENCRGLSPWLMDQRRARSTVDRPAWLATKLNGAQPSGRSEARWPTGGGAAGRGCMGSPSWASPGRGRQRGGRAMAVKKRWRRRSVQAALGREEKRRRAGRGAVENGGSLPLYRG
jgi:hypothetical protein